MTREAKRHPLSFPMLCVCLLCVQTVVASRGLGQSNTPPPDVATATSSASTVTPVQTPQLGSSGSANVQFLPPQSSPYGMQYGAQNAGSSALIVLTRQAKQRELAALTEDLNIMCRVFDRALAQAGLRPEGYDVFARYFGAGERRDFLGSLFTERASRTECLYVEGYGPLFLVSVDFPLEPPETAEPSEPNAAGDPVWDQVAREMAGRGAPAVAHSQTAQPQYNAEKVLSLRSTLTRSLKHASNIRGLSDDSCVTVLVKATPAALRTSSYLVEKMMEIDMYAIAKDPAREHLSLLAIRATVKDIADFASGSMNQADFEERLESAQY